MSPADLAVFYIGLGDKEAALQSLERAYAMHDPEMQYLKTDPSFDPPRGDSRFADLLLRVGFPQN